ncbi:hypothetical protein MIR68_004769 [Amoeboaphelidium protococcarum]|nr:hypothetical protein MIR68_004769 [Amoeboaphelidium protococcarum]
MNTAADRVKEHSKQACTLAKKFVKEYYSLQDGDQNNRQELIRASYNAGSAVVYNGNVINVGANELSKYLTDLPPTRHYIDSIDAQPLLNKEINVESVMVSCSGSVTYGRDPKTAVTRLFTQKFVIKPLGVDTATIESDAFRFT